MNLFLFMQPLLGFFFLVSTVLAQLGPYQPWGFNYIGRIDTMTLNANSNPLRGGTVTVDGQVLTVPDNMIVTLPSINVAWAELFNGNTPNLPQLGTVSWDINVFGNVVNGQYICGIIYISQNQFQILQGFITSIDTTSGQFTVGQSSTTNSFTAILNDPTGVYGPNYTANPLWSVDPQNPSVRSFTGFPMCIPRSANDPACPAGNRPKDATGKAVTSIQFADPATITAGSFPDPRLMVPLVVGDWVTFSGVHVGGGLIAVYSLTANLALYTKSGTQPSYITVNNVNFAITDNQGGAVGETRAVAQSTDVSTLVQWYAMDVNPCTGAVTERDLLLVQPLAGAPIGQIVYREGKTTVPNPTRSVGFKAQSGSTPGGGPNGVNVGMFIQPVLNYIFPEFINFGQPMLFNSFDTIPYLAQGQGPYFPGNPLTPQPTVGSVVPVIGQPNPWPGPNAAPAATSCPPFTVQAAPTSSSVAPASSSAAATTSSAAPKITNDIVTITSVTTGKSQGGITPVTVVATCSRVTANLSASFAGNTPLAATPMTSNGKGQFTLTVSVKGPKTVTVTSDGGGSATAAA